MSTEQRLVRPYAGTAAVQSWLDTVSLEFAGAPIAPGRRTSVAVVMYVAERLAVLLADDATAVPRRVGDLHAAVSDAGFPPDRLEIVLVLSTPRLKVSEVAWRARVDRLESAGHRVDVGADGDRPVALSAPFGGCEALLAIVLAEDVDPVPLRPARRGTWLATTRYQITTDLGQIGFTPIPLTDEVRREHGLPPRTLRLLVVDRVTDPEMESDAALSVYVDQDVLAQLTAAPHSRGSKSLQMQLFLDAMTAVVYAASREMASGEGSTAYLEAQESLLGSLFTQMAARRDGEVDVEQAQRYWSTVRHHPDRAVALVEGWLPDFKKALVNAISDIER